MGASGKARRAKILGCCAVIFVTVGTQLAFDRLTFHGRHYLATDHQAADISPARFLDVFLHQDVMVKRHESLDGEGWVVVRARMRGRSVTPDSGGTEGRRQDLLAELLHRDLVVVEVPFSSSSWHL